VRCTQGFAADDHKRLHASRSNGFAQAFIDSAGRRVGRWRVVDGFADVAQRIVDEVRSRRNFRGLSRPGDDDARTGRRP